MKQFHAAPALCGLFLLIACGGGQSTPPPLPPPPSQSQPLTITSGSPPSGQAGAGYGDTHTLDTFRGPLQAQFFQLSASEGPGSVAWSWAAAAGSTLPPGLECCDHIFGGVNGPSPSATVHGVIFGTPTVPGTYRVTVTLADAQSPTLQTSDTYTITILPSPPPVINTTPTPPIATRNSPYVGFTFTVTNGLPPLTWMKTGSLAPGLVLSSSGSISGIPTAVGTFPISVTAVDSIGQSSTAQTFTFQVLSQGFAPTGNMGTARSFHSSTLLNNGNVLIIGGFDGNIDLASAELFDSTSKTFRPVGSMSVPRSQHVATLLSDGRVLVTGGFEEGELATAEIFDPATNSFSPTGSPGTTRPYTATLLNSGKVLMTGGDDASGVPTAAAEIFDPASGTFTPAGNMGTARALQTATRLNDGTVLVVGGIDETRTPVSSAEIFDPNTGTFAATGSLTTPRSQQTATLLNTGKVLLTGGNRVEGIVNSAELFDPTTKTFSATGSMKTARATHTATQLANGQVLITGGFNLDVTNPDLAFSSAEIFDPTGGTFSLTADMTSVRNNHTATLLNNGQVLIAGGDNATVRALASAELYH